MAFKDYIYESDDSSNSYLVRLDSDQATLSGGVTGVPTDEFHVIANGSRRKFGINPRHIIAKRTVGTAPNEKTFSTRLCICTVEAYDAISLGQGVSINGINYAVSFKSPETKR